MLFSNQNKRGTAIEIRSVFHFVRVGRGGGSERQSRSHRKSRMSPFSALRTPAAGLLNIRTCMIQGSDEVVSQSLTISKNALEIVEKIERGERIYETMTLWMDLLGFRSHLDHDNWDLHQEATLLGMKRIAAFHEASLLSMNDRYEIVQINDAVVISQDIPSTGTATAVGEFLALVDAAFERAALVDSHVGGAGVRGVVAKGFRYNLMGNLGWTPTNSENVRSPNFFCPRPLMMNTAFGRAYGVESSHELTKSSALYVEWPLVFDYEASIMETWSLDQCINVKSFGAFMLVRS